MLYFKTILKTWETHISSSSACSLSSASGFESLSGSGSVLDSGPGENNQYVGLWFRYFFISNCSETYGELQ